MTEQRTVGVCRIELGDVKHVKVHYDDTPGDRGCRGFIEVVSDDLGQT